jgi:hypothetical protein
MRVFISLLVVLLAVGLMVGGCGNGDNGVSDPGDGNGDDDDNDNPPPEGPEGMTATITGGEATIDFNLDNEYSFGTFSISDVLDVSTALALWANGEEEDPDYHLISISFSVPLGTTAPAVLPLEEAPTDSAYALFHYFENVREGEEILFGGVGPGIGTFEGTLNLSYLSDTGMAGTFSVTCEIGGDITGTRTVSDGEFYLTSDE